MKVLKKIFIILEFTTSPFRGAGDIASYLDLSHPTCTRLLKQLLNASYMQKKYLMGNNNGGNLKIHLGNFKN